MLRYLTFVSLLLFLVPLLTVVSSQSIGDTTSSTSTSSRSSTTSTSTTTTPPKNDGPGVLEERTTSSSPLEETIDQKDLLSIKNDQISPVMTEEGTDSSTAVNRTTYSSLTMSSSFASAGVAALSENNSISGDRKLMATYDVRFNKFQGDPRGFKPLTRGAYPVYGYVYDTLIDRTDAVDVYMLDDDGVRQYDVMGIINKLGGLPSHPEEDENAPFWDVSSTMLYQWMELLYSVFEIEIHHSVDLL